MKPTVTDRDIGDLVHYELIGIQREFLINEGIIMIFLETEKNLSNSTYSKGNDARGKLVI